MGLLELIEAYQKAKAAEADAENDVRDALNRRAEQEEFNKARLAEKDVRITEARAAKREAYSRVIQAQQAMNEAINAGSARFGRGY